MAGLRKAWVGEQPVSERGSAREHRFSTLGLARRPGGETGGRRLAEVAGCEVCRGRRGQIRRCLKFRSISSIIPRLPLRCHSHSPRAPLEASQGRLGASSGRLGASWGDLVKILDALEAPKTTVRVDFGLFSAESGSPQIRSEGRLMPRKMGPKPGPKPELRTEAEAAT